MIIVPIPRAKPEEEGSYHSIIPMLPCYNSFIPLYHSYNTDRELVSRK